MAKLIMAKLNYTKFFPKRKKRHGLSWYWVQDCILAGMKKLYTWY